MVDPVLLSESKYRCLVGQVFNLPWREAD